MIPIINRDVSRPAGISSWKASLVSHELTQKRTKVGPADHLMETATHLARIWMEGVTRPGHVSGREATGLRRVHLRLGETIMQIARLRQRVEFEIADPYVKDAVEKLLRTLKTEENDNDERT